MGGLKSAEWQVYIVACADGTYYTGITTDLSRRLAEHNQGRTGAKYTRSRRPVRLVYSESASDRSAAARREYAIKQLSPARKFALVESGGDGHNNNEDGFGAS